LVVFNAEGKVFFRSVGKVNDPGFAVAVFDLAVVCLILEMEAAVFHGGSPVMLFNSAAGTKARMNFENEFTG
jgi:hypothetical protein